MKIENVTRDGLRGLIENNVASGLQTAAAANARRIVSFLQDIAQQDQSHTFRMEGVAAIL